jgi:hypothetical protein
MPTQVQLPDGNIGEFPDGMAAAQIEAVLRKQYPPDYTASVQRPGMPPAPNPIAQDSAGPISRLLTAAGAKLEPQPLKAKTLGEANAEIYGTPENPKVPFGTTDDLKAQLMEPAKRIAGGDVAGGLGEYLASAAQYYLMRKAGKLATGSAPTPEAAPQIKFNPADLDQFNSAAGVRPEMAIPKQDVVAGNPGEVARLASVGSRMTQPVTLPSQNRGLALPAAPVAEEVAPREAAGVPRVTSNIPRTYAGESVLNEALTSLDNKSLLKVARSRGLDVTQEAQLKPGLADQRIIRKVIDSFTPDELAELRSQGIENSRFSPQPVDIENSKLAADAWHVRVLQSYFPDVAIPKALLLRSQKAQGMRLSDLLGAK